MKRTYQTPAMTVVNIQHESVICDSPTEVYSNVTLNLQGTGGKSARSRDVIDNDWDEDWEQEY